MTSYAEYYQRAMRAHATGFKLVVGGTGLGKTRGFADIVCAQENRDRKFMYLANRKQLLEQMATAVPAGACVIVRRDLEVVAHTLRDHGEALFALLDSKPFGDAVRRANDTNPFARVDLVAVRRALHQLKEALAQEGEALLQVLEDEMDAWARLALTAVKGALIASNDHSGDAPAYRRLADQAVVQSLFPAIAFKRRDEVRLLLLTVQKAFFGYFDGRQVMNLSRLQDEDGGLVICLDECDYLEHDLVELICGVPDIANPFRFVEHFYTRMKRHKLPLEDYPLSSAVRDRIQRIIGSIDQLRAEGLHFPDINQFTATIGERAPSIWRTRHTVSAAPLFVRETERAFHLVSSRDADAPGAAGAATAPALPARRLFDTVTQATDRILQIFKKLERTDPIIYREMLRHCFQDTVFPHEIERISQFPRKREAQRTELGSLLERGYSYYDVHELQQRTDRDEVAVRHYGMHATPEKTLATLAQHNLVFGLSATADLPRVVHNFDFDWLAEQQVAVIDPDEDDLRLIEELDERKARERGNRVRVVELSELDPAVPEHHALLDFLAAFSSDEEFGEDTRSGHLRRRVELFFATLLHLRTHATAQDTALLFLNTFRQIKLLVERCSRAAEEPPQGSLFSVAKRAHTPFFDTYEITLAPLPLLPLLPSLASPAESAPARPPTRDLGEIALPADGAHPAQHGANRFLVVFYNAKVANTMYTSARAQRAFDALFWEGEPVVVVTQYQSAGNGVNLQYRPREDAAEDEVQDFTHIGLLEAPYYYFGNPDDEDLTFEERTAQHKQNLWYQSKLYASRLISEARFRHVLGTVHIPRDWNVRYQTDLGTGADALANHMATFIQALGRVERVWRAMPDQTVLLSREVYGRFEVFCGDEYEALRQRRERVTSANVRQVFDHVRTRRPERERSVRASKDARLGAQDSACREAVAELLARLSGLRAGTSDRDAREQWTTLRRAVLRHDLQHQLLRGYQCVASSPYYADGTLHLTADNEIVPARLAGRDTYRWRMDALYDVIEANLAIRDHFVERGYELRFGRATTHFFTPYCYQAILAGGGWAKRLSPPCWRARASRSRRWTTPCSKSPTSRSSDSPGTSTRRTTASERSNDSPSRPRTSRGIRSSTNTASRSMPARKSPACPATMARGLNCSTSTW